MSCRSLVVQDCRISANRDHFFIVQYCSANVLIIAIVDNLYSLHTPKGNVNQCEFQLDCKVFNKFFLNHAQQTELKARQSVSLTL